MFTSGYIFIYFYSCSLCIYIYHVRAESSGRVNKFPEPTPSPASCLFPRIPDLSTVLVLWLRRKLSQILTDG